MLSQVIILGIDIVRNHRPHLLGFAINVLQVFDAGSPGSEIPEEFFHLPDDQVDRRTELVGQVDEETGLIFGFPLLEPQFFRQDRPGIRASEYDVHDAGTQEQKQDLRGEGRIPGRPDADLYRRLRRLGPAPALRPHPENIVTRLHVHIGDEILDVEGNPIFVVAVQLMPERSLGRLGVVIVRNLEGQVRLRVIQDDR